MDTNKKTGIPVLNRVFDSSVRHTVEGDVPVPDYKPELFKIVKAYGEPIIVQTLAMKNKATVEGLLKITVLYLSGNGEYCGISGRIPFSKQLELKEPVGERYIISCDSVTDYLNCRVVGKRRIEASGEITFNISVTSFGEAETFSAEQAETGIEYRTVTSDMLGSSVHKQTRFTINDAFPFGKNAEILRINAAPAVDSVEISQDGVVVQGNIFVSTVLAGDSDDAVTRRGFTLPFRRMIDSDDDFDVASADASLVSCTVTPDDDGSIEVEASCMLTVDFYGKSQYTVMSDAYGTAYETEIEKREMSVISSVENFNVPFAYTIQSESGNIIDCFAGSIVANWSDNSSVSALLCTVTACDDDISCNEVDINVPIDLSAGQNDIVRANVFVDTVENIGSVVNITGRASGTLIRAATAVAVTDIKTDESRALPNEGHSIVIYYPDEGEDLFEIAKSCRASYRMLSERGITAVDGAPLIIPLI